MNDREEYQKRVNKLIQLLETAKARQEELLQEHPERYCADRHRGEVAAYAIAIGYVNKVLK
jgi:hypothetical protein